MNDEWNYNSVMKSLLLEPPPSYNCCPPGYRSVPVEVKPINVNLTVNSSKSFTVFQKEQVFNTSSKQIIIIPDISLKLSVEKDNNNSHNNGGYKKKI